MRFLMPIGFLAIVAGFSAIVMLLWNWLMPAIFGLVSISFWQALGLLILSRILFGSFGGGQKMFGAMHRRVHCDATPFLKKWMGMTPEQKKEFFNKRMEHLSKGGFFGDHLNTEDTTPKESE